MRLTVFSLIVAVCSFAQTATQPSTSPSASKPATTATGSRLPSKVGAHAAARRSAAAAAPALTTDEQKTVYAAGLFLYKNWLQSLNLTPEEMKLVIRGLQDQAADKPALDLQQWGPKIQQLAEDRQKKAGQAVIAKAAAEPGAIKTDSGMVYRQLRPGAGDSPKATDTVKVNYRGTLPNGSEFDSSYKRNEPAEFPLDHVIKCWTEGVQKMKVGEKAELTCPAELAYGAQGRPGIPPNSVLTFEVELLGITPPAPDNKQTAPPTQK